MKLGDWGGYELKWEQWRAQLSGGDWSEIGGVGREMLVGGGGEGELWTAKVVVVWEVMREKRGGERSERNDIWNESPLSF